MIRIAIIEDNNSDFSSLVNCINKYFSGLDEVNISRYYNGESFIKEYARQFDLCVFDIELPGDNGMSIAKEFRLIDEDVPLFFTTNVREYVLNGYEVNAYNYLLKPINYYSLALTLNRIMLKIRNNANNAVKVNSRNGKIYIYEKSLKCIYINNHSITYHTTSGDYTNYGTLKGMEDGLSKMIFVKVNSYSIININYISSIRDDEIIIDSLSFKISRGKKKEILNQILKLKGGY